MSGMRVYFSRSFAKQDEKVYSAIRAVLDDPTLRARHNLELTDSKDPKGKILFDKIKGDIIRADVVVGIFTRRHKIRDEDGYSAPAYVCSETAYALSVGKRLILFLESGVASAEMGLVNSMGLEYVEFDRTRVDQTKFRERARSAVEAVLTDRTPGIDPDHLWRGFEVHHSVFANRYVLTHFKFRVLPFRSSGIRHAVRSIRNPALPSEADLLAAALATPCPYPNVPFVAFSSPSSGVRFEPTVRNAQRAEERAFQVTFPEGLREYEYQWIWGSPEGLRTDRDRDYFLAVVSNKAVDRVDILLRMHRGLPKRKYDPCLSVVRPTVDLEEGAPDSIHHAAKSCVPPTLTEETPLYRSYHFTLTPVPRGSDLAVIY